MVVVSGGTGTTGYAAQVNGKYFAAQIPVTADINTISAIATDQTGAQHQASVLVTVTTQPDNVNLLASPNVGIPTLKENGQTLLDVSLMSTTTITIPVRSYAWDFNGSDAIALTCYSHSNVTASYQQTGLYLTTVTVADAAGSHFTDTAIVNVVDADEMNRAFKTIWSRMKTALLAGDISTALADYSDNAKSRYRQIFTHLIDTNSVAPIYTNIADIVVSSIDNQIAECWAIRPESDGMHAYPITFVKDGNGIWKIMGY
jgi:hypothetical protein